MEIDFSKVVGSMSVIYHIFGVFLLDITCQIAPAAGQMWLAGPEAVHRCCSRNDCRVKMLCVMLVFVVVVVQIVGLTPTMVSTVSFTVKNIL